MSEHSNQPNTTPEKTQEVQESQVQASQTRNRQRSVIFYISIMFIAAFLLLSMSLVQERRQHSENLENLEDLNQSISGLKDSVSAMQSVQQLYEQNAALNEQLDELKQQLDALEQSNALLQGERDSLLLAHEGTIQAMDWFWQINEAYVRGRYTLARQLIERINEAGLVGYLPTESITDNGRFSPRERYQEIYDRLY